MIVVLREPLLECTTSFPMSFPLTRCADRSSRLHCHGQNKLHTQRSPHLTSTSPLAPGHPHGDSSVSIRVSVGQYHSPEYKWKYPLIECNGILISTQLMAMNYRSGRGKHQLLIWIYSDIYPCISKRIRYLTVSLTGFTPEFSTDSTPAGSHHLTTVPPCCTPPPPPPPPIGESIKILNTADWLLGCSSPPPAPSSKDYGTGRHACEKPGVNMFCMRSPMRATG